METGQDVADLLRKIISQYVEHNIPKPGEPEWIDELNDRRCRLIKKDLAGEIALDESIEMQALQRRCEKHFDRIAGPDIKTAEKLLNDLLSKVKTAN